ncbi:MAG: UvrD-helicase domain-containing protein [Anaerolineales bacterium]
MAIFDDLNPQQQKAVTAPQGPVLVLAGPGSGKTRVLTHRLAYLLQEQGASRNSVMAVTFTNKAAREMEHRVMDLLGASGADHLRLDLGTFHALAARMLRREANNLPITRDFVIFDSDDQQSLVKQALNELNLDSKQYQPAKVHGAISNAKNELVSADELATDSYFAEIVQRIYHRYQDLLLASNAVDFDDLLFYAVDLLRANPNLRAAYQTRYLHILVDEFQDTNSAQYSLLRLLAGVEPDLFVVGDVDQSIYRWRGADYRNVHRFERDFPSAEIVLLEQNYRSTQMILDAATAVIDRVPGRKPKRLFTERRGGAPIVIHEAYNETEEAQFVIDKIAELTLRGAANPGECAIMYRTNAQSRVLEEAFLRAGLPYRLVGAQRFYGRREVKDVIGYLRLIHNPQDDVSLLRVINTPSRGIGAKTIEALLAAAAGGDQSPGELLIDLGLNPDGPAADPFSGRAASALSAFGSLLANWREGYQQLPLDELIRRVLADSGYRDYIDDGTDEGLDRWENVQELLRVAEEFGEVDLVTFLEHVALVSDQDTLTDGLDAPILLTLHSAKGLEFRVVFIVGLNEGIFPHQRSFDDPEEMAEERRLFYVGITRAKDRLYLLHAFRRRLYGQSSVSEPSRFLDDIPADKIEGNWAGSTTPAEAIFERETRWEPTPEPEPVEAQFHAGMHVIHPTFGQGIVMDSRPDSDDEEVIVAFPSEGIKHLLASLADLEVSDEG